ncbi:MAG: hypothetical protein JXX29_20930 [Deltaproteobacteria bacterium]|nr:hypothetical protein [Deltaproteobacteria bacterium]MBN2674159.1 hypothetical protein [Deltaproteobacteria bacterium]
MKRFSFYFTAISIFTSLMLMSCGGAQSGSTNSSSDSFGDDNSPPPAAMEEYNYFMEQAGLALAEQRLEDALDYYLSAAETLEATGKPSIKEADAHYEAAQIAYQKYQKELAVQEYEKAAAIYLRFSGNAQNKAAVVYTNLGVVWKELHEKSKARTCWQQALEIYTNLGANDQNKVHIEKIQQNIRDLDEGY